MAIKRDKQRRILTILTTHKWLWVSCSLWVGILLVLVVIISTSHPDLAQPIEFLLSGKEICCPKNETKVNPQGKLCIYPKLKKNEYGENFISLKVGALASNVKQLQKVISEYPRFNMSGSSHYTNCFLEDASDQKPCLFERSWLGPNCSIFNRFGYEKSSTQKLNPCFLFRIESSGPWKPDSFNPVDIEHLNDYHSNFVKLQCDPKDTSEQSKFDHLTYWPARGFPRPFFPARENKHYLAPAVMVQVEGLKRNTTLNLQCWLRIPNAFLLEDNGVMTVRLQS